jgi:PAS domain S-box-containing protein
MNKAKNGAVKMRKSNNRSRRSGPNGVRDSSAILLGVRAALAEHESAERALRESQGLLSAVTTQLPIGLGVMNKKGEWIVRNTLMERFAPNATPSVSAKQRSRWRILDKTGKPGPVRDWPSQRALRGQVVPGLEMLFTDDDGRQRWMRVSSAPLRNQSDTIIGATVIIQDVDSLRRAENIIRDKEQELEQIVTTTPFMLTRCTRDLRYRYASNAYAQMAGCTLDEIAGRRIVDILGKDGLKTIRPYVNRVLAGETVDYESIVPFRDGRSHFLHCVYVPDKDQSGRVIGWIASITDLTERKRVEGASLRLAAVVQSSNDAIVAKDLNGIVTDWNKSAQRIFGYTPKEIIGKSILTIIPKDRHDEETEILRKVRHGHSIDHFQTVRRRKDGTLVDVSLTISPVSGQKGNIIGVSKIARDITGQKQIERRLAEQARLLDLSNDAILVRDARDKIIFWNHGATDLYGYSAEEAVGKTSHTLLLTKHPEALKNIQRKLHADNRWTGELIHQRKDGTKVIVISRWSLDRDASGRPASILETNNDITQRNRAEAELQRSRELLEQLVDQRTKALRAANTELESEICRRRGLEGQILEISDREQERLGQELHDGVCQRLTAIAFMTRAIALRLKDHRVADPEEIENVAQLINSAVMDARNLARDLHKEEIDAAGFQETVRGLAERKIWKTPCRIHFDGDIDIEDDHTACELFRILREAVINANKHAGATEIVIEACRRKRELIFSVTDNGAGFNLRTKGRAIDGLGVHIMQYRAQSIGARLELESPRRGGTRVAVYLPLEEMKTKDSASAFPPAI